MYAIEFSAKVKDGTISIPKEYRNKLQEEVKVIVMKEEKEKSAKMIDQLLDSPLKVKNFKPFSREEVYER